ncbi:hypothetical protein HU200_058637 [Digitaria exilis]|uniref:Uncharacterized protein n=1 Tax=Digitaria exilis TaxID=1010633 RepID=A0A835A9D4_9POAL|nr:hypothetical protein HU200_058637 [Digitaria exilis]
MVGLAAVCWLLWKARNNNCFEYKKIRSPTEMTCLFSSFFILLGRIAASGVQEVAWRMELTSLIPGRCISIHNRCRQQTQGRCCYTETDDLAKKTMIPSTCES